MASVSCADAILSLLLAVDKDDLGLMVLTVEKRITRASEISTVIYRFVLRDSVLNRYLSLPCDPNTLFLAVAAWAKVHRYGG